MEKNKKKKPDGNFLPWSLEFTIPGGMLPLLRINIPRVKKLFKTDVVFSDSFERGAVAMQWVCLMGGNASAEEMKKAKSYIISMTNPEACISVESFPPSVYRAAVDEVEISTLAFLTLDNNSVQIKGSELSVVLAQSMLENIQADDSHKSSDATKSLSKSSNPPPLRQSPSHSTPKEAHRHLHAPSSTSHQATDSSSFDADLTHVKRVAETDDFYFTKDSPPASNVSNSNQQKVRLPREGCTGVVSTSRVSDGVDAQRDYLTRLGLSHNFHVSVIEEGLKRCDMDEVVQPTAFLEILNFIKSSPQQRPPPPPSSSSFSHTNNTVTKYLCDTVNQINVSPVPKRPSSSVAADKSKSDSSIIVIEDEEEQEEEEEEEEYEAIVISSDEENENKVQPPKAGQANLKKKRAKKKKKGGATATITPSPIKAPSPQTPATSTLANSHAPTQQAFMPLPIPGPSGSAVGQPTPPVVPPAAQRGGLRYIIIDGNNVAMAHGEGKVYSVRGIQICIQYFLSRGHKVTTFVPESRRYANNMVRITGKQLMEQLNQDGHLKFTPARRITTGRIIASYDDRFILNLAEAEQGIVVSNDQYRDLLYAKPSYREIIETRLLPFTFVGDHFMPPDDPLGRYGPTLDQFLSMGPARFLPPNPNPMPMPMAPMPMAAMTAGIKRHLPGPQRSHWIAPEETEEAGQRLPRGAIAGQGQGHQTAWQETNQKDQKVPAAAATKGGRWRGGRSNVHQDHQAVDDHDGPGGISPPPVRFGRSPNQSQALYSQLVSMFPEPDQLPRLLAILDNHPEETDITRLSNYVLNALVP